MSEKQILVNQKHKDNVFRILYRDDKKRQMELYNAVSGKNYTDAEELQVVTLKHAIYMGMKNDLAFIVFDELHLYEHQSTVNPNMPLRFLHYISKEYEGLVESRKLYGSKPVKLQAPYFTVFYNGTKKYPERIILKLSDLYKLSEEEHPLCSNRNNAVPFEDKGSTAEAGSMAAVPAKINDEEKSEPSLRDGMDLRFHENAADSEEVSRILEMESPFLELKVLVLNINSGNNTKFLEQCPTLREYMKYVERVRKYLPDMELEAAVKRAVDECIREGILEDFFRKNKAEVIAMSIFEYDEKEVIDYIREEERAIGREEGKEEGREEGKKEGKVEGRMEGKKEEAQKYGRLILRLTEEGKSSLVVKIATDDALRERLYEEYQL